MPPADESAPGGHRNGPATGDRQHDDDGSKGQFMGSVTTKKDDLRYRPGRRPINTLLVFMGLINY
jgi:hypothetical protein